METSDKKYILFYKLLVILLWLSIWGIFEEIITYLCKKNITNRITIYILIASIIIGIAYYNPEMFNQV
jgi:hypothetical protein